MSIVKLTSCLTSALGALPPAGAMDITNGAVAAGKLADLIAVPNCDEVERREHAGLDALPGSLRLLDDLLSLPVDVPVHTCALPDSTTGRLRAAPSGCVRIDGDRVTRLLRPALAPVAVVCSGPTWRSSMALALTFRPFAPVYVRLPPARELHENLWEAQLCGVGVLVDTGVEVVLTLSAPHHTAPMKAARWRFAENAHAAVLAAAAATH